MGLSCLVVHLPLNVIDISNQIVSSLKKKPLYNELDVSIVIQKYTVYMKKWIDIAYSLCKFRFCPWIIKSDEDLDAYSILYFQACIGLFDRYLSQQNKCLRLSSVAILCWKISRLGENRFLKSFYIQIPNDKRMVLYKVYTKYQPYCVCQIKT